jgi:hypothetical protein
MYGVFASTRQKHYKAQEFTAPRLHMTYANHSTQTNDLNRASFQSIIGVMESICV